MLTRLILLSLPLALAACSVDNDVTNAVSRSAAKSVVTPIVEEKFPNLPASDVSDCVIDNSETSELIIFTRAAVTGPDDETYEAVARVLQRRDTIECVSEVALASYLGGIG